MSEKKRIFYLSNVCHVCKSPDTKYSCLICKLVFYCSPQHRRKDWFYHYKTCWAVNKICKYKNVTHLCQLYNEKNFTHVKNEIAGKLMEILERNLECWELEMIYHPRVCDVCYEFDFDKLEPCDNCKFIYTCTDKKHFNKNHKKWCEQLKLYYEISICEKPNFENVPMTKLKMINNKSKPYKSMNELLNDNFEKIYKKKTVELNIFKSFISDFLTYPLTVLNVFKSSIINIDNNNNNNKIKILFIGSENQSEIEPINKWEYYFLHFLSNVKELHLIFLGPELKTDNKIINQNLCNDCRSNNKKIINEFVSGKFYHEYLPDCPINVDLICAFNSGMYRNFGYGNVDSWKETIFRLFNNNSSPILITEYTGEELQMDLNKLKNQFVDLFFLEEFKSNPFSSLKPGLNVLKSKKDSPVIYKNNYRCVLKPKCHGVESPTAPPQKAKQ